MFVVYAVLYTYRTPYVSNRITKPMPKHTDVNKHKVLRNWSDKWKESLSYTVVSLYNVFRANYTIGKQLQRKEWG